MFDKIKSWFNRSWSIFLARAEVVAGVVITAVSTVDFTSLLAGIQSGLTWGQGTIIGGLLIFKGIITELARRQNTVTLSNGQLMPKVEAPVKEEAVEVVVNGKTE